MSEEAVRASMHGVAFPHLSATTVPIHSAASAETRRILPHLSGPTRLKNSPSVFSSRAGAAQMSRQEL
jgi:hypothetical protein